MEKESVFLEKIKSNEKKLIITALVIGVLFIFLAVAILYILYSKPAKVDLSNYENGNDAVEYSIDDETLEDGGFMLDISQMGRQGYTTVKQEGQDEHYITLSGWAFVPEKSIAIPSSSFILRDKETGLALKLRTTMVEKEDVTQIYGKQKHNYDKSGMYAVANKHFLQKNASYEVLIAYTNDGMNYLVETGIEIQLGKG